MFFFSVIFYLLVMYRTIKQIKEAYVMWLQLASPQTKRYNLLLAYLPLTKSPPSTDTITITTTPSLTHSFTYNSQWMSFIRHYWCKAPLTDSIDLFPVPLQPWRALRLCTCASHATRSLRRWKRCWSTSLPAMQRPQSPHPTCLASPPLLSSKLR